MSPTGRLGGARRPALQATPTSALPLGLLAADSCRSDPCRCNPLDRDEDRYRSTVMGAPSQTADGVFEPSDAVGWPLIIPMIIKRDEQPRQDWTRPTR